MLMSSRDAETWKLRLSSAEPIVHSHLNVYTSASVTRYSARRSGVSKHTPNWCPNTHAKGHTCTCIPVCSRIIEKATISTPNAYYTHTHIHTGWEATNPLSTGVLSLHQINKRAKDSHFWATTPEKVKHCAFFYSIEADRVHKQPSDLTYSWVHMYLDITTTTTDLKWNNRDVL